MHMLAVRQRSWAGAQRRCYRLHAEVIYARCALREDGDMVVLEVVSRCRAQRTHQPMSRRDGKISSGLIMLPPAAYARYRERDVLMSAERKAPLRCRAADARRAAPDIPLRRGGGDDVVR